MGYERYNSVVSKLNELMRPHMTFLDTWQAPAVDALMWTVTNPATGTAWTPGAVAILGRGIVTAPNANEVARLVGNHQWDALVSYWGNNSMQKTLNMEFEAILVNVANMDNTITFFGLTNTTASTRASTNIIGFGLNADVLQTVTDAAGVEQTTTGFLETLTDKNRFGIQVSTANVKFLLNGSVIATHATTFPRLPMYVNFYVDTEATGAATLDLGKVRVWWTE